jgi:tryptophan synthase beta subunit
MSSLLNSFLIFSRYANACELSSAGIIPSMIDNFLKASRVSLSVASPTLNRLISLMCLLQNEYGNILETHSVSAGLDYPGVGPEHSFSTKS